MVFTRSVFYECRRELLACIVLTIVLTLISLVPALTVGAILDRVVHTRTYSTLVAILIVFGFFHICEAVFTYVYDRLMLYVTQSSVVGYEREFLLALSFAKYEELEVFAEHEGQARFMSIGADVRFLADWIVGLVSIPLCLIIVFLALYFVSLAIALPIFAVSALYLGFHLVVNRKQRSAAVQLQLNREEDIGVSDEIFRGLLSLKAHNGFGLLMQRWEAQKNAYERILTRFSSLVLIQNVVGLTYERVTLAFILGIGAYEAVEGRLSIGQLVMANMLFRQVATQVRQLSPLLQRRVGYLASKDAMHDFLIKHSMDRPDKKQCSGRGSSILASDISYVGQDGLRILQGVSFKLQQGYSLAVIGESGSGKSTLLKILAGLYRPSHGGVAVLNSQPHTRNDFVYLSQKEYLFVGSLSENILLGGEHIDSLTELLSHLDLHSIDRRFGEQRVSGAELSGGERQRIFVARAVAKPFSAIFLDEPTTALDAKRREAVVELVSRIAQSGKLVVFATHDEDLARKADYVLHLENGRVVSFNARGIALNEDSGPMSVLKCA